MGKQLSFIKMDIITSKPYMMDKTQLVLFATIVVILFITSGNVISGLSMSLIFGNIFAGNPFIAKLDTLYLTLAIDRKTIVRGRYIFAFVTAILSTLVIFVIGFTAMTLIFGFPCDCCSISRQISVMLSSLALTIAMQVFFQSISLPINFKQGEVLNRIFGVLPMLIFMLLMRIGSLPAITDFLGSANGRFFATIIAVGLAVIIYISYQMSLAFYNKREF